MFLKGLRPANLLKKDSGTSVFLWMTASEGRKNYYTHRQPWALEKYFSKDISSKTKKFSKYKVFIFLPDAYLEPSQKSTIKPFCENNKRLLAINYFRKKALSQMFDWVLFAILYMKQFESFELITCRHILHRYPHGMQIQNLYIPMLCRGGGRQVIFQLP